MPTSHWQGTLLPYANVQPLLSHKKPDENLVSNRFLLFRLGACGSVIIAVILLLSFYWSYLSLSGLLLKVYGAGFSAIIAWIELKPSRNRLIAIIEARFCRGLAYFVMGMISSLGSGITKPCRTCPPCRPSNELLHRDYFCQYFSKTPSTDLEDLLTVIPFFYCLLIAAGLFIQDGIRWRRSLAARYPVPHVVSPWSTIPLASPSSCSSSSSSSSSSSFFPASSPSSSSMYSDTPFPATFFSPSATSSSFLPSSFSSSSTSTSPMITPSTASSSSSSSSRRIPRPYFSSTETDAAAEDGHRTVAPSSSSSSSSPSTSSSSTSTASSPSAAFLLRQSQPWRQMVSMFSIIGATSSLAAHVYLLRMEGPADASNSGHGVSDVSDWAMAERALSLLFSLAVLSIETDRRATSQQAKLLTIPWARGFAFTGAALVHVLTTGGFSRRPCLTCPPCVVTSEALKTAGYICKLFPRRSPPMMTEWMELARWAPGAVLVLAGVALVCATCVEYVQQNRRGRLGQLLLQQQGGEATSSDSSCSSSSSSSVLPTRAFKQYDWRMLDELAQ